MVSHNALKKIWRSHIFAAQSQWHLSNTKTGDTTYQATCTASKASTAVLLVISYLVQIHFHAVYPSPSLVVPVPRLLIKPSLWIVLSKFCSANPLLRPGAGSLLSLALIFYSIA
ncbi:hypothetical protein [Nostoc sp.]|uniref:hypothetical protein n=1 Tax=Nostoc sp. TaxID=1180 RepID=UPI002FF93900